MTFNVIGQTITRGKYTYAGSQGITYDQSLAVLFNGTSDNAVYSTPFTLGHVWTVEAFLTPAVIVNGSQTVQTIINYGQIYLNLTSSGYFQVVWTDGSSTQRTLTETGTARTAGKDYHVAATSTNGVVTLYVNGQQVAQVSQTSATISGTVNIAGVASQYCNGAINDVRIWNVVRDISTLQLYKNKRLVGTESGLVSYWKFNEDKGSTIYEFTSNARNLTLIGGTWQDSRNFRAFLAPATFYGDSPTGYSAEVAMRGAPTGIPSSFFASTTTVIEGPITVLGTTIPSSFHAGSGTTVDFVAYPTAIPSSFHASTAVEISHLLRMLSFTPPNHFPAASIKHSADPTAIPSSFHAGSAVVAFPLDEIGIATSFHVTNALVQLGDTLTNLSPLIALYSPALGAQLRALEVAAYATGPGIADYGPKFTALSNAIVSYFNSSWNSTVSNFMNSLSSYIIMNKMYGTDSSLLLSSYATTVFSMNGYFAHIMAQSSSYYSDWNGSTSPHIDADITTIGGGFSADKTTATNLITNYNTVVSNQISSLLFANTPPIGKWTKTALIYQIFTNMGYSGIYKTFNISLPLPPTLH